MTNASRKEKAEISRAIVISGRIPSLPDEVNTCLKAGFTFSGTGEIKKGVYAQRFRACKTRSQLLYFICFRNHSNVCMKKSV